MDISKKMNELSTIIRYYVNHAGLLIGLGNGPRGRDTNWNGLFRFIDIMANSDISHLPHDMSDPYHIWDSGPLLVIGQRPIFPSINKIIYVNITMNVFFR